MKLRTLPGNPLFIPETYGEPRGAANAFYTYGEFDGIGICPFGIESLPIYGLGTNDRPENPGELPLARAYEVLRQLSPLIIENMGTDKMRGGLEESDEVTRFAMEDYAVHCYKSGRGSMPPGIPQRDIVNRLGALFISLRPAEYLVAGSGPPTVELTPNTPGPSLGGILFIDEGNYVNGTWVPGRRLNGDENSQRQRFTLRDPSKIYRVKAYRYRRVF